MKNNKWVLLTGGTGLLGRRFIHDFFDTGWNIAFVSHTQESMHSIINEYAHSRRVVGLFVDLLSDDAHLQINKLLSEYSILPQALVNNARSLEVLSYNDNGFMSQKNWLDNYKLEVYTAYALTMTLATQPESKLQSVVNVGSMYGIVAPTLSLYESPKASAINYGVTKAALTHLSKELAIRLADRGIRVNTVSFGGIEGRASEDFKLRYGKRCPQGKMLTIEQVAKPVLFLLSEDSSGITGHNLVVDGGWTVC